MDMKVLLIDDSKLLRGTHEKALVKAGYSVISVGDGEEGIRVAREQIPDLILLDMMLPKISGLDVLRNLKGDPATKNIPVIVLSGLAQANEFRLIREGAAAFIEKSCITLADGSATLIQAVEKVVKAGEK
jgi:CheY-like chemotaxis protein